TLFVGSLDSRLLSRHLACRANDGTRNVLMTGVSTVARTDAALDGTSAPLGASVRADGVNFSVFSKDATLLELLLFDGADAAEPSRTIPLEPKAHRSYHYWHAFVPGLRPGQLYAYRA